MNRKIVWISVFLLSGSLLLASSNGSETGINHEVYQYSKEDVEFVLSDISDLRDSFLSLQALKNLPLYIDDLKKISDYTENLLSSCEEVCLDQNYNTCESLLRLLYVEKRKEMDFNFECIDEKEKHIQMFSISFLIARNVLRNNLIQ